MKSLCMFAMLAVCGSAHAQVNYTGGTYTQNFDTLPSGGSNPASWQTNATLPGWFTRQNPSGGSVEITQIRHDDGSSAAEALYSYGPLGSLDRALGSLPSGSGSNTYIYALILRNTSSITLTEFTLSYTGEQWRDGGGNVAFPLNVLNFDYKKLPATAGFDIDSLAPGYIDVGGNFDFTALTSSTTAQALDGNAGAYRTTNLGGTVSGLSWARNEYLVLRWRDVNDLGNDQGLAIDDLVFSAIPAPGATALVGLAGLAGLRRRRA